MTDTDSDERDEKEEDTQYGGTEDHNLSGAESEEKASDGTSDDESADDE